MVHKIISALLGTILAVGVAHAAPVGNIPWAQSNNIPVKINDISGLVITRTLQDRFSHTVDVKDFGAKCDGTTDDSAALQNLFTTISTSSLYASGVQVSLPAGICYSSKLISLSTSDARPISLNGLGAQTSAIQFAAGGGMSFSLASGGYFQGSNFHIQRTGTSASGDTGLFVTAPNGSVNATLANVTVNGTTRANSWINGAVFQNIGPNINNLTVNLADNTNINDTSGSAGLTIEGTVVGTGATNNLWAIDSKIVNSTFQGGFYGIHVLGAVQGVFVANSEALGGVNGFFWKLGNEWEEPELLMLTNFHSNSHYNGVYTDGLNEIIIQGGLFLHFGPANTTDPYTSVNLNNGQNATVTGTMTDASGYTPETVIQTTNFHVANITGNQGETIDGPIVNVINGTYTNVTANIGAFFPHYTGDKFIGCGIGTVQCVSNFNDGDTDINFVGTDTYLGNPKGNTYVNGSGIFLPQVFATASTGFGFNINNQVYNALTSTDNNNVAVCPSENCAIGAGSYTNTVGLKGITQLLPVTKVNLVALANSSTPPATGSLSYDSTDNTLVVYQGDGWYPVTVGTKLSN